MPISNFNFRDNIKYNEFVQELQTKLHGLSIKMIKYEPPDIQEELNGENLEKNVSRYPQ